jgi:cytochrome b
MLVSLDRLELAGAQHDPLAALMFCALMTPVDYVIVNGKVVVDNKKLITADELTLIRDQQKISDELVARAERNTGKRLHR